MRGTLTSYMLAIGSVAVVAAITAMWHPVLGIPSSALLFLLPVLLVAPRGDIAPALVAAAGSALAYNFFLLPPRFTFRIHSTDNLVSVFVLFAVAVVTSRLATALKLREAEADARAETNAQTAAFSSLLGRGELQEGIAQALHWLSTTYGEAQLISLDAIPVEVSGFSTLDLSASAWAMHNGDITGHGSAIMPASDWTFLPLSPRKQVGTDLLAIARPDTGSTRGEPELAQLQALARLIGQARDRLALEQERHARERLEDRDALRHVLLASVAHDFRTPLTVVSSALARLADGDDGAADALIATRRVERMMNDLVGAARIESGALAPQLEAVDLVDAVADARSALGSLPEGVVMSQQVSPQLPLVDADPVLLRHILINLLDNAARHARSTVIIDAAVNGAAITLWVEDDGPGIAPEQRAQIFDRFARIESTDRTGGSGLGLAIVKGFADAMNMSVGVEDGDMGGARFRLTLRARQMVVS